MTNPLSRVATLIWDGSNNRTAIVNALLFRPLGRVMQAREGAVRYARHLAAQAEQKAAAATAEYETQIAAARAEVYREMDATRRAALEHRAELLNLRREERVQCRRVEVDAADVRPY